MSQVLSINRVFLHKLHHPPCCLGNCADWGRQFYEDDRDTWSQSQNEEGPSPLTLQSDFRRILAQPSSLKHQQRSDTMVPFRDYEISFLFLLLVKFHGSGKSEMYAPVQSILQFFFIKCYFKLRHGNGDPSFRKWCSTKWFPNSKMAFNSFCISKFRYDVGISITW